MKIGTERFFQKCSRTTFSRPDTWIPTHSRQRATLDTERYFVRTVAQRVGMRRVNKRKFAGMVKSGVDCAETRCNCSAIIIKLNIQRQRRDSLIYRSPKFNPYSTRVERERERVSYYAVPKAKMKRFDKGERIEAFDSRRPRLENYPSKGLRYLLDEQTRRVSKYPAWRRYAFEGESGERERWNS